METLVNFTKIELISIAFYAAIVIGILYLSILRMFVNEHKSYDYAKIRLRLVKVLIAYSILSSIFSLGYSYLKGFVSKYKFITKDGEKYTGKCYELKLIMQEPMVVCVSENGRTYTEIEDYEKFKGE